MSLKPLQAAVLCGGLGTRLGALTADRPKPLIEVAGRPFLDLLLNELGRYGFGRVLLLAGFAGAQVEAYAAANTLGLDIEVVIENAPAGTAGAVWNARDRLDDAFLLLNGDSWFDIDLAAFATEARAADAAATLALRRLDDAARYGVVELDGQRIVRFRERPETPGPGLVNAGVYWLAREALEQTRDARSFEAEVAPALARAGRLRGAVRDGYFIDIGMPEALARAQSELADKFAEFGLSGRHPGVQTSLAHKG